MATTLLEEIEDYLSRSDYSPTYFGKLAANQPYLVAKLRGGAQVIHTTAERVRTWMRDHPPEAFNKEANRAARVTA